MTNGEKYKTAKERAESFVKHAEVSGITLHGGYEMDITRQLYEAAFAWLDLEAPAEEPLPCPFCGATSVCYQSNGEGKVRIVCDCGYKSIYADDNDTAIVAHNRVARAAKEKEAK